MELECGISQILSPGSITKQTGVSNMEVKDKYLVNKFRDVIRATEGVETNNELNILKKVSQKTRRPGSELKRLLDKYEGLCWDLQKSDDGINMYTSRPCAVTWEVDFDEQ